MADNPVIVRATGIAWYRHEDYARILAVMEDAEKLPPTWEQWFQRAKQARDQLRAQGHVVEQVNIDPDTFPDWCRARGLHIDSEGRRAFANSEARRIHGGTA